MKLTRCSDTLNDDFTQVINSDEHCVLTFQQSWKET